MTSTTSAQEDIEIFQCTRASPVIVETLGDTLVKKLAGTVKFANQGIKWGSGTLLLDANSP